MLHVVCYVTCVSYVALYDAWCVICVACFVVCVAGCVFYIVYCVVYVVYLMLHNVCRVLCVV